jgi:hypothetical protein
MPGHLHTKVGLSLDDKFSPAVKNAGKSVNSFKDQAVNAANSIEQAFSSAGAKLATLGVTIGAAALVKASVEYEDSIIRIGTNAGMSGKEVNQFRRELLAVATDAKVPIQELVKFSQTVTDNSIGLDTASESARFMADAMQGLGLSGQEAADIFSVLYRKSGDIDTVKQKLNNLAEIDNRLQGMGLSAFAKMLPQLMETSDTAIDGIEDLYVSVLTLNNGATNKQALTQYTAAMQEFANKRDAIRNRTGFDVKDQNGELKSFAEIMTAIIEKGEKRGGVERFIKAFDFGDNTIKALKQFNKYSAETIERVSDMGDTSNAVKERADQNAKSLASSLVSLQNNILKLADASLTKPIERLAKLLDEHPKGMERAIRGVGFALIALTAMKAFSTVVTFLTNVKGVKGLKGGGIGAGLSGGAVMPVFVTNWGGMGGFPGRGGRRRGGGMARHGRQRPHRSQRPHRQQRQAPRPHQPPAAAVKGKPPANPLSLAKSVPAKQLIRGGVPAALFSAAIAIPEAIDECREIDQNEDLTAQERAKAKGGAKGEAAGSIVGSAGGAIAGGLLAAIATSALAGTAIGTVVPGLGNIAGLLIGAGVGAAGFYFGGKAGRKIGEAIGEAGAKDGEDRPLTYRDRWEEETNKANEQENADIKARLQRRSGIPVSDLPPQLTRTGSGIEPLKAELDGKAVMDVNVNLSGTVPTATVAVSSNTTPLKFNPGSALEARLTP